MTSQQEIQLGKNRLTSSILEEIKKRFDSNKFKNIKIHVLKSARESKEDVKKYAEEIQKYLGSKYTCRIIGFSIFIKKWRKARVKE
jgi:RNA-binding protein YhbY